MKNSFFLFAIIILISCNKQRKCFNSISGIITNEITGEPIEALKVYAQGRDQKSDGWNLLLWNVFLDTILTDENGYYEFSTDTRMYAWEIQTFGYGYKYYKQAFFDTPCEEATGDISVTPLATIRVSTVDVPELSHDSVYVYVVPGNDYLDDTQEFGVSDAYLAPGQTIDLLIRIDPAFNRLGYQYLDHPDDRYTSIDITPSYDNPLEFEIRM